jgi:ribosomal protein L11 methyltransferase
MSDAPAMDWSAWRASVSAHRLGKLMIAPPWLAGDSGRMTIVIDPAMAFGTGEHATTRGVVRLMQQVQPMPARVADLGAGSAVLAICAAKLGARRVVAIELDPDAIGNAEENVAVNGVSDLVHILEGDAALLLPLISPVELVLANIISSVLIELLPVIASSLSPRGHAILSGILVEEKDRMLEELERGGWLVLSEDAEQGWWSVLIQRPL